MADLGRVSSLSPLVRGGGKFQNLTLPNYSTHQKKWSRRVSFGGVEGKL